MCVAARRPTECSIVLVRSALRQNDKSCYVILVVGDSETNREMLNLFLSLNGYEVMEAQSDVRVTMRYVRTVEESKRAAVDAVQLNSRKNVHVLATWPKQPPLPAAVNG
jgi:CheY-like chemotaxis protein